MPNSLQTRLHDVRAEGEGGARQGRYLTVATTGGAATWDEGYDLWHAGDLCIALPARADAIMAMGYDFNWCGSARAGGVSPLDSPYVLDVRTAMADYLAPRARRRSSSGACRTTGARGRRPRCRSQRPRRAEQAGRCTAASWAFDATSMRRSGRRQTGGAGTTTGQVPWYRYQSTTYGTWVQGYYDDAASLDREVRPRQGERPPRRRHLAPADGRVASRAVEHDRGGVRPPPFTDIAGTSWEASITWVYQHGIMGGCSATKFCPSRRPDPRPAGPGPGRRSRPARHRAPTSSPMTADSRSRAASTASPRPA